jgi:ornithine cyclodeaminase/alanine dehydrogenase-like protein (mu-crystallin family)
MAEDLTGELPVGVSAHDSFEQAMEGADVVCACTHSPEPVVRREAVAAGMHINSVGYTVEGREVDAETVRDSVVVVEWREGVLAPPPAGSNDLAWPVRDGVVGPGHIHGEVGELVRGTRPGRTSAEQITLYKSIGVGVQDAAAAGLVLRAARAAGVGLEVDL